MNGKSLKTVFEKYRRKCDCWQNGHRTRKKVRERKRILSLFQWKLFTLQTWAERRSEQKRQKQASFLWLCARVNAQQFKWVSTKKKWEIIFLYLHRLFRSLFAVTLHCDQNQRNDGNRNWAINNNESWNFFKHKKWSKLQTNFSFTNHISWE